MGILFMAIDYKMVLHNSAIVINNCSPTDFPTLTRRFQVYDPVCHRVNPVGVYYDKDNRKLYLPRGIDVEYVRRKVSSSIDGDCTITVVHSHPYGKMHTNINMKYAPRDNVQVEALKFALCKDKYSGNFSKSQFGISLSTGKGKTYISACVMSYLKIKSMVVTSQTGILDQWKDRLHEYTDIDESEIVKIQGSHMITRILSDKSTVLDKSIYLCTHSTLQSYGSQYGWDKISDLFRKLKIGIKFFDEAHQNFQNMALIDFATRDVWRTYYITATPARSDRQEDLIYKLYMKNIPSLDLFNPDIDPHTKYVAIKYNSMPKPSDVNACKISVYGLSNPKYIEYLMGNYRFWVMFDYIFSFIYRNGGKALFYIGTNFGIEKVYNHIINDYPELINDIGIYSSINPDKKDAKDKRIILSTTKSAGAGEDIKFLKYSVVLAEPFKSEVLARQTLGRTRDPNTIYIELVDVGFRQVLSYFNSKRQVFNKYATETNVMNVDNVKIQHLEEDTRIDIQNRFNRLVTFNSYGEPTITFVDNTKPNPLVYFTNNY